MSRRSRSSSRRETVRYICAIILLYFQFVISLQSFENLNGDFEINVITSTVIPSFQPDRSCLEIQEVKEL